MDRRNHRRFSENNRMADEIERLLPMIPDEVTLDMIVPKLCWGDRLRLASVSRGWLRVVRDGEFQRVIARSCFHVTETFILLRYKPSEFSTALALYSIQENRCYKVPAFPYVDAGVPRAFQCVAVDGKFYFLGGKPLRGGAPGGDGVYMLDLANGMQWKRCASMIEPRKHFGCAVFGGKIYVLGGLGIKRPLCGSEVYDPKEDTWSRIKGMPHCRCKHQVVTMGNELIVLRGRILDPDDNYRLDYAAEAKILELYNPAKNEWRVVEDDPRQGTDKDVWNVVEAIPKQGVSLSFTAERKLHMMCGNGIYVRSSETQSWTQPHSFSLKRLVDTKLVNARTALAVDDRLFTVVEGIDHYGKITACQAFLVQSKDLGSSIRKIRWEKVPLPIYLEEEYIDFTEYSLQSIQLQLNDL